MGGWGLQQSCDLVVLCFYLFILCTFFMPVIYHMWKVWSTLPVLKLFNDHLFIDLWEQHTDWQSHQHGTFGVVRFQNGRSQQVMAATPFHARIESESMTTRDSSWLWQPDALLFICLALQNPKLLMWKWQHGMNSWDVIILYIFVLISALISWDKDFIFALKLQYVGNHFKIMLFC